MQSLKSKGQWAVCLSALLLGIFSLSSLQASCHNSSSSSSESTNCSSLVVNKRTDESFEDLQAAIDAAESGDVLKLRGKFVGSFQIFQSLTLKGSEECETILDGNNNGRVLTIVGSSNFSIDVVIKNLVIRHGLTNSVGGGIASTFTNLTLDQVKVTKNVSSANGGGISSGPAGSLTVLNSAITHNSSATGGGISDVLSGSLIIRNSKINHNQATANFGGGIFLLSLSAESEIVDSDISHNQAALTGGGLFNGQSVETEIQNSKLNDNEASYGGGIYNIGDLEIVDSEINDNQCLTLIDGNSGKGGGIFNDSDEELGIGSVILRRSIVKENEVLVTGGGIFSTGDLILKKTVVKENQPNDIVQEE